MNIEELFSIDPYSISSKSKKDIFKFNLLELSNIHYSMCEPYRNILNSLPHFSFDSVNSMEDLPFIPVRLFKMLELRSSPKDDIIKTLTSSGTTSQQVSKIFLNKETALLQTKALVNIINSFIGKKRLPMILIDSPNVIKNRASYSARGAGLMGLVNFGRDHLYLLDESMNVRWDELEAFLDKHRGERILLFGFTFMIWKYFYEVCIKENIKLNIGKSVLIHSGGWKKLEDSSVDNHTYKKSIKEQIGIEHIYNFYGMVEQVGSIFMECESGFLHAPNFADVVIRDQETLEVLKPRNKGLVQVLSLLPKSYPGHSLLTEDVGEVIGEDDCSCGRKGKYFTIYGRLPAAELRGCSDTHAFNSGGSL